MKTCWHDQPDERPTFADITHLITTRVFPGIAFPESPLKNSDMFYDTVASYDSPAEEDTTTTFGKLNDDESLFDSILDLLPKAYKLKAEGTEVVAATPSGAHTDYYMQMKPFSELSRGRGRVSSDQNDYYNHTTTPATTTGRIGECKQESCDSVGESRDSVGETRPQSAKDHTCSTVKSKDKGVSRNVSNVSDYFPMFAAEPAKPKSKNRNTTSARIAIVH